MIDYDRQLAMQFKEEGIKRVCENNKDFLKVARNIAYALAKQNGTVTCDDVRRNCPIDPLHHNAWGGLFGDNRFHPTEMKQRSAAVQGHGNWQRVWRI